MDNYLRLLMIIYLCRWLFVIIDVFSVDRRFLLFVIIYLYKEVFFVKNTFIIISSIDK